VDSISKIAPKPRKILQLLRLLQINNGVFVRVTKATQQMLRLVEPYITYGWVVVRSENPTLSREARASRAESWLHPSTLHVNFPHTSFRTFPPYSEPNLKAVKELVYKRGYAKIAGQRIPLHDNSVIEKALGKHGLVCVEDLVHELITCGPNFKAATTFLYPFKLSNPNG
jgi:large subunit ribosomal protein L7e